MDGKKLSKFDIDDEKKANRIKEEISEIPDENFKVLKVKKKRKRQPAKPFITSTLQGSVKKTEIAPRRTMGIAQELYTGIDLGDGPMGLITYMRQFN